MARGCQLGKVSNKVSSPHRSLEPLDPEGPSPPVLSTFLSPVPSTSLDPPEHFPLRKTGKALRIVITLTARSQEMAGAEKQGGLAPQSQSSFTPTSSGAGTNPPCLLTASEPNLKVRCKPRKCLDRRKNPLTRKESAPPSLKRRPPEAIGEGFAWMVIPRGFGETLGPSWSSYGLPRILCHVCSSIVSPGLGTLSVSSSGHSPWRELFAMMLQG